MRSRAADDFDFIGKRLQELVQQKITRNQTPDGVVSENWMADGWQHPAIKEQRRMTRIERFAVAKAYECAWNEAKDNGCGNAQGHACLKAGRCTVKRPGGSP